MLKKKIFIPVLTLIFVFSCLSGTAVFADEGAFPKATESYGTYTFEDQNAEEDFSGFFVKSPKVKADPLNNQNKVILCDDGQTDYTASLKLTDNAVIQFDFYQDTYSKYGAQTIRAEVDDSDGYDGQNKTRLPLLQPISDTTLRIIGKDVNVSGKKWYTVKYIVDFSECKVYAYFGEKDSDISYFGEWSWTNKLNNTLYRFQIVGSADSNANAIYIDNLSLNSYSGISEQIKACTTADNVIQTIEFYCSNKLITTGFNLLSEDDKAAVAAKILSDKNTYTDDASVITALNSLIDACNDGSTLYYKWDFKSGSTKDYVNGKDFLKDNSSIADESVIVAKDPVDSAKNVLMADLTKSGEKITYTTALSNDIDNIRYVVYDVRAYKNADNVILVNSRNYVNSTASYTTFLRFNQDVKNSWNTYKSVYDKNTGLLREYKYDNGAWNLYFNLSNDNNSNIFQCKEIRLSQNNDSKYGQLYFDTFEVKGYKDFYTEINNATESNVLKVVDAFKDMNVITLPTAYASMDDNAKTELAAALKSKKWTSDDEVITFISCELSDNELVAISDVTEDNTLKSAEFAINKDGITASGAIAVFASYGADNTLIGVSTKVVTSDFAKYSVVSVSDINLDVTDAAKIKYMLINNLESLTPITASLTK